MKIYVRTQCAEVFGKNVCGRNDREEGQKCRQEQTGQAAVKEAVAVEELGMEEHRSVTVARIVVEAGEAVREAGEGERGRGRRGGEVGLLRGT